MKILLLGRDGQIGGELQSVLAALGELTAWGRNDLDLSHHDLIREKVRSICPDIIINAAAYTAVDRAESEYELAMAVNGVAPGILAEEAAQSGALLVHYSTDYVFDGAQSFPYTEEDETNPLSAYGRSKLAGDQAICAKASRFLIFRTEWVYDMCGRNFLTTIKRVGAQRPELGIVDDQIGAPTWSREIARTTVLAIRKYLQHPRQKELNGIYNLTAQGQTSWFGFAQEAAEHGLFADAAQRPILRAIPGSEYPTSAKRPMYSVLSNEKLLEKFGLRLPDWKVSLQACMRGESGGSG